MQNYSYKDIARMADVSIATVSHVINKTRFVSPELTERVMTIIEELNYKQNIIAGSLRNKKTMTIGLILPDSTNEVYAKVGLTVDKYCSQFGYSVIFCNSSYDQKTEKINIDLLRMKNVDGIILIPATDSLENIEALETLRIPFVLVNRCLPTAKVYQVFIENETAGEETAKFILSKGSKRVIYLDRVKDIEYSFQRKEAFLKAFDELKPPGVECIVLRSSDYYFKGGYEAASQLIKNDFDFDAVVAYNDYQAIGLLRGLKEHGIKVPEDVIVLGFDNMEISQFCNPSLSTMEYPFHELGLKSAELLLKILNLENGNNSPEKMHSIKTKLIERESTNINCR